MGLFDTFSGWSRCPYCDTYNPTKVQFTWHNRTLSTYTIGDYVHGKLPYTVFEQGENDCLHCKTTYNVWVIGHFGTVYGFANESEWWQLEHLLPFETQKKQVTFIVDEDLLKKDIDLALKKIKESYSLHNEKNTLFIFENENLEEINRYISRIPSFVKDPGHRPEVGDTYYYDNRANPYSFWERQNDKMMIKKKDLNEDGQYYLLTLESPSGEILNNIHERLLVNEAERNDIVARFERFKADVLNYWQLKNKVRDEVEDKKLLHTTIYLRAHHGPVIAHLKRTGELPETFSFD